MKTVLLLLLTLLAAALPTTAQTKASKKKQATILAEGYKLYHSERASWQASDLFLQNYPQLMPQAGGYFSYQSSEGPRCVFFSKGDSPKALISFTFDDTFNPATAQIEEQVRAFTAREAELYAIRAVASAQIMSDTLFQAYDNTKLNLVPLIEGNSRKVYVLTGPQVGGVVILGNDYLLSFNKKHELVSKQKLHQNIIPVSFADEKEDEATTLHSHLPSTGDYMTPTDICTLLLYGNMSNWKQHYTMSENFMSIWEVDKAKLTMVSRKAWDKIMQQQDAAKKQ